MRRPGGILRGQEFLDGCRKLNEFISYLERSLISSDALERRYRSHRTLHYRLRHRLSGCVDECFHICAEPGFEHSLALVRGQYVHGTGYGFDGCEVSARQRSRRTRSGLRRSSPVPKRRPKNKNGTGGTEMSVDSITDAAEDNHPDGDKGTARSLIQASGQRHSRRTMRRRTALAATSWSDKCWAGVVPAELRRPCTAQSEFRPLHIESVLGYGQLEKVLKYRYRNPKSSRFFSGLVDSKAIRR